MTEKPDAPWLIALANDVSDGRAVDWDSVASSPGYAESEATVAELAEPFEMCQPAISKHLKVLERAGLISMDVDAQRRPRKLELKRLEEAVDWIERYREIFEQNYQRLDALLEELQAKPSKRKRTGK